MYSRGLIGRYHFFCLGRNYSCKQRWTSVKTYSNFSIISDMHYDCYCGAGRLFHFGIFTAYYCSSLCLGDFIPIYVGTCVALLINPFFLRTHSCVRSWFYRLHLSRLSLFLPLLSCLLLSFVPLYFFTQRKRGKR